MRIGLQELAERFDTTPDFLANVLYQLLKIDQPIPHSISWDENSPVFQGIIRKLRTVFKKEKFMAKAEVKKTKDEAPKKKTGPQMVSLTEIAKAIELTASEARAIMRRAVKRGDIEHDHKARWEFPVSERAGVEKILKAGITRREKEKEEKAKEKDVKAKPTKKKPADDDDDE